MKKKTTEINDELRPEYSFDYSKAVRGKYYRRLINRCKSTCYSVVVGVVSTYAKESNKDEAG